MPYYEFLCDDCNAQFELKRCIQEIDHPAACPICHGEHVARQISRVMAFSHGDDGSTSAVGGGGCAGCGGGTCGSCGKH